MNYWLVWPVGIVFWLAAGWAGFAWFEAKALRPNAPENQPTLSRFVYTVGARFPLSIFLLGLRAGLFWGGLAVHFFWHSGPPGSVSVGALLFILGG